MTKLTMFLAATALISGGAIAQTTPPAATAAAGGVSKVTTGATVTDTAGATVGTIKSVDAGFAVLSTGTVEVRLPLTSFAAGASGPVIALTKAQVESAASGASEQQKAKLAAQIAPGTTVMDQSGGTVGKIEAVEGEFATVATAKNKVKLPVSAFASGETGPVIGMTAAQLDAAAAAAAPTPTAAEAPKSSK